MMLGIIPFVGEHGPDPGHDRESSQEQALEDERTPLANSLDWPKAAPIRENLLA